MFNALFDHLAWADARALEALRAMPQDTPEAERARAIYAHVVAAEHVWLSRIQGRAPIHAIWPTLTLEESATLARECAEEFRALAELEPGEPGRTVKYSNSTGQLFVNTLSDLLAHVALHGSYHRGQLALLARQCGSAPASTDYITYLREPKRDRA